MMNTFPNILAMCGPHLPSLPYRLLPEILGSGLVGLVGWLALFAIPVSGLVVIARQLLNSSCHARGTHFFPIAHVCFLVFLNNSIVSALQWTHAGTVMISLATGLCVALVSVGVVTAALRRLPKPTFWPCFGFACAAASIALLAGLMLTIIHSAPLNH